MNPSTIEEVAATWKHVSTQDWHDWRWQIRNSLSDCGGIRLEEPGAVIEKYRFRTTPYYLSLANYEEMNDPILLQCIPDARELCDSVSSHDDPFGEEANMPVRGLIHRFTDRALLVAATSCAVYCRHCTRKNVLPRMKFARGLSDIESACRYLSDHPEIREIIISGGDPLLLENRELRDLLGAIRAIPRLPVIRIGTRVPVVLPMRIDDELCLLLKERRPLWLNTQFNHPAELTGEAVRACRMLQESGIPVSNQSVLLHGVNDSLEIMRELCAGLHRNMIRPYYVFMCDPVSGIDHFRVSLEKARAIEDGLRTSLGGLCLPRFVADLPGELGKTPV